MSNLESRHILLNGIDTNHKDSHRLVFLGECGFWTDDFNQLSSHNGVPDCPCCGSPGVHTEFYRWLEVLKKHEKSGATHFVKCVNIHKEICLSTRYRTRHMPAVYREWVKRGMPYTALGDPR